MVEGEAPTSGWRVRYDGSRGDVDALKAWLEREESLSGLVRAGELRIVAKSRRGDGPEYMGSQTDLVLVVIGTVANLTTIGASLAASARALAGQPGASDGGADPGTDGGRAGTRPGVVR